MPEGSFHTSTFVDLGSGLGRAVLLASEYPFKQVVGVELSPALHAIARANLSNARNLRVRCRDVRLCRRDVSRHRFPKGDLVVFLFNPFDDVILRATLDRIVVSRSAQDRVILLYHTPVHRDVVTEYAGETIADLAGGLVVALKAGHSIDAR